MDNFDLLLSYIQQTLTKKEIDAELQQAYEKRLSEKEQQKVSLALENIYENYISEVLIERRIDALNEVILKYAQHSYGSQIEDLTNNDLFDSLITSINFLGQELNYSTVTRNYLQDIFNSIDDVLLVVDKEGRIDSVNNAACIKLGFEREELVEKQIKDVFVEEIDLSSFRQNTSFPSHYHLLTKLNVPEPVLLSVSPFVQGDGQEIGVVFIAKDITEFIKYQQEIESQNEEIRKMNKALTQRNVELVQARIKAEESERLKAAFLANVSHEIRTPMNSIIGFADLLTDIDIQKNQDRSRYLNIIKENTRQLLSIIEDIVDISKIEANQVHISKKAYSIQEMLEGVYENFAIHEKVRNEQIALVLNNTLPAAYDMMMLDKYRMVQVLNNLLSNAFKFTAKGEVEIFCKLKDQNEVLFGVRDTGVGIDKRKQEIIFDRFKQAESGLDRRYGGTGLGLSISKALVELMGGEIWVESEVNKGAVFCLTILYEKAVRFSERKAKFVMKQDKVNWKGRSILVVEDNPVNRLFYEKVLERTKAEIFAVGSGEEAVEFCQENKNLDLILMDIQLPGMDGVEATRRIRKFDADVLIIAQTANVLMDNVKEMAEKAGCDDYITKPVEINYLFNMVDYYFKL